MEKIELPGVLSDDDTAKLQEIADKTGVPIRTIIEEATKRTIADAKASLKPEKTTTAC